MLPILSSSRACSDLFLNNRTKRYFRVSDAVNVNHLGMDSSVCTKLCLICIAVISLYTHSHAL